MSYEGYSQFLCKNGHYWEKDCNELPIYYGEGELVKQKCPKCGEEEVFENMVDVTNGNFDDDGNRIDGYIDLKVKSETSGKCSACGEKHICETIYEIPKKEDKKMKGGENK